MFGQTGIEKLKLIEKAGKTCYKAEHNITEDSYEKFIAMIIKRGHESVIEHASFSVRFICDRGCYDDKTEVLTRDGWKFFKNINFNDEIACLNDKNILTYEKQLDVPLVKSYNGNLLHFENTSLDLMVTPDHKMWVLDYDKRSEKSRIWKFIDADKLNNNRYTFTKTSIWDKEDISVSIPAHPKQYKKFKEIKFDVEETSFFFELLGLWITDGCYKYGKKNNSGSFLVITQTKEMGIDRINFLCEKLKLRYSWNNNNCKIDNLRLVQYIESLFGIGAKTFSAKVPDIIKNSSKAQIKCFLDGVILGDGNIHKKNNHIVIYSSSEEFANDIQELFLKIGLSANIRYIPGRHRKFPNQDKISYCKDSFIISVHAEKRSRPMLYKKSAKNFRTEVPYNGNVYCLTVPGHRLYVRRNGKAVWCGNCSHELVRHRLMSFSQESTRYCTYNDTIEFIIPSWMDIEPFEFDRNDAQVMIEYQKSCTQAEVFWINSMLESSLFYELLLIEGWRPEQARSVLPNSLKTEIVMTGNLRNWKHVFNLRDHNAAHPQMQELMTPLHIKMQGMIPGVFD